MASVLTSSIDAMLERRSMLKHPFYQAWDRGGLTRDALRAYACQYFHFVREFPRMISAVHANTPVMSVRQELLLNLMEEENGPENHPALWMRFARAVGASPNEISDTIPLPTTRMLVETMMNLCRNGSFQEGTASLHAYESQIPAVAGVKIRGLRQFYGITDAEELKFFTVHEEADVLHSRTERQIIDEHTPVELEDSVLRASERTAEALWKFLDGVYETYVVREVAAA